MGADKMASKGGGFFNLFDWNKKSRKKLFASGNGSPDGKKQVRRSDDNLPSTRFHMVDDNDDDNDMAMIKESSDYSCASSVTDGEGNGSRAPGVVARLMGLDSLPTNGVLEPCSTPYRKRSPEFEGSNRFMDGRSRPEVGSSKLPDWRFQKMPSSPIERFQREVLPPRSAKSLPLNHYKLLSPIKNPKFAISSRDAAHIMETAAKILEPGFQTNSSSKAPHIDSYSLPLTFRDPKEYIATPQRTQKQLDLSRAASESNAIKCLRGRSLNRSWNGSEGSNSCRSSPGRDQGSCVGAKSKGKSVSLAIQAKVNVQKRVGKEQDDDGGWIQPVRNQASNADHRPQKKALPPHPSGVLKQNNQKQNCPSNKDKLPAKRSLPNNHHHGRKASAGSSCSSDKGRALNKFQLISKGACSKEGASTSKEASCSRTDNVPRKKRLIDGSQQPERRVYDDGVLVFRNNERMKLDEDNKREMRDMESFAFVSPPIKPKFSSRLSMKMERNERRGDSHSAGNGRNVQANVVIDEKMKQAEDNMISETDVASFTFTSPLAKPKFGSSGSCGINTGRKGVVDDCNNGYGKEWSATGVKNRKWPSHGLNMMGDDALSILLEEKLRGLAFQPQPYGSNPFKFSPSDSPSTCRNSPCSDSALSEKVEQRKSWIFGEARLQGISSSGVSSMDGQELGLGNMMQMEENSMECCSSSSTCEELDQYASPFSVLEANFSNESCNSCESYDYDSHGIRACSSVLAQNANSSDTMKIPQAESELDLSDSASSSLALASEGECRRTNKRATPKMHEQELEYIKEILFTANVNPKNFIVGRTSEKLDPLLFDLLESKKSASASIEEDTSRRKLVFDCARECLDSTQGRFFHAGYQAWARGTSMVKRESLCEAMYGEIRAWEGMADWIVDQLVDKDMSSQLGKRDNFENDAFEAGVEIQKEILSTLIDELVVELLM